MAKQVTSGPTWRTYSDQTGKLLGWVFLFFGIVFAVIAMFRPPDSAGTPPGPVGSIVVFLVGCVLSGIAFSFHRETHVDGQAKSVSIRSGFGQTKAGRSTPLSEFQCIAISRIGTRSGLSAGFKVMLDGGPTATPRLVVTTFDRQDEAQTEAEALSTLTGLPVRDPANDPRGYRGLGAVDGKGVDPPA